MGFKATRKRYLIVFEEGSDLEDLEITAVATTLGERRAFLRDYPKDGTQLDNIEYEVQYFVNHVTGWNLEDEEGNPQPVSVEAMNSLADEWVTSILTAWAGRSLGQQVSNDLKKESNDGNGTGITRTTEESIPMESLP